MNLSMYYSNFLEAGLVDVGQMIENVNEQNCLTFGDLESIGIKKPGHIFRILIRLEMESKYIDEDITNFIFCNNFESNKSIFNSNNNNNLVISNAKSVNCCFGQNNFSKKEVKNQNFSNFNNFNHLSNLINWLNIIKLPHLRKNFVHNGFDDLRYFIIQMFSSCPFDDAGVEEYLHIYSKNERRAILSQLAKDLKAINMKISNLESSAYSSKIDDFIIEGTVQEEGCKRCSIF